MLSTCPPRVTGAALVVSSCQRPATAGTALVVSSCRQPGVAGTAVSVSYCLTARYCCYYCRCCTGLLIVGLLARRKTSKNDG